TWIANFIWGIADDVLRDLYVRGKYRDVSRLASSSGRQSSFRGDRGRVSSASVRRQGHWIR
ncbi:MAG: hypothetical protein ACRD1W_05390, partial [Vicinamibacterales bacterium]